MGYTIRRLLIAATREFLTFYAAKAGERLARRHFVLPPKPPKRTKRPKSPRRRR